MAVPRFARESKGSWKGTSQLHMSHLPPDQQVSESSSELRVEAHGAYAMIAYTWSHEGEPQEGTMLVAMDDETKAVEIGWVDSFHSSAGVMHFVGTELETGAVRTAGSFAAGDETWGWTIAFALSGDELNLTMEVVPPGEESEWAVRASYTRV